MITLLLGLACTTDADGDGVPELWDCDDTDSALGSLELDRDCDGFVASEDCDDRNAAVNPGQDEVFGDDLDNDCDGVVDIEEALCAVTATLTDPDGVAHELDLCGAWAWQPLFSFSGFQPPVLTGVEFDLGAEGCRVEVAATELCEMGWYALDGDPSSILVTVTDCPGGSDVTLDQGWLRVDSVAFDETVGDFQGQGFEAAMTGAFGGWHGDWSLEGAFELASEQPGEHWPDDGCSVSATGDEDGDGFRDAVYGGEDCDDSDPNTFPGAAENESDSDCMRDGDGDGYGDDTANGDVIAGVDCEDADPAVWLGAASAEPSLCTADADGDGFGDHAAEAPADAGADCNDDDATEFPGALANEDPEDCGLDADGDGWADRLATAPYDPGHDCNDADADEYPGAVAEGGADKCMRDVDGDGFGDATAAVPYDKGTDCVDTDPDVYSGTAPNEPTVCGLDEDGDGWAAACDVPSGAETGTDCNDHSAHNGADWYPGVVAEGGASGCMLDEDGDGWGDDVPPGFVGADSFCYDAGTDCDDDLDYVYPGAAPNDSATACMEDEDDDDWGDAHAAGVITDGSDCYDKDGAIQPGAATEESTLCTRDADGDGWGDDTLSATYGNADDGTDCDDSDATIYPDAIRLDFNDGVDVDCEDGDYANVPLEEEYGPVFRPSSNNAGAGAYLDIDDVDGDGLPDLYVSGYANGNLSYLLTGPVTGWDSDLNNADAIWGGSRVRDGALGDLDGDGYADLVQLYAQTGYAYLGPVSGTLTTGTADFTVDFSATVSCFGTQNAQYYNTVTAGDVTGDGQDDLILGLPTFDLQDCDALDDIDVGGLFLLEGPLTGNVDVFDEATITWTGDAGQGNQDGGWPAVVQDLDGDGVDDLVATRREVKNGETYGSRVLLDVANHTGGVLPDEADVVLEDHYELTGAGDTNGDGYGDLLGAEGANIYLYLGSTSGIDTTATASATHSQNQAPEVVALGGGGDFDGDGYDDVFLEGTWLVFGPVTGSISAPDADFDWDTYSVGRYASLQFADLDDDGFDDLVIGNVWDSEDYSSSGAVYVIWGE